MDAQKLFFPVAVGAAVLGIWATFRKTPAVAAMTPNPSGGGVVGPYTQNGVVQPMSFPVAPVQLAPNPFILLSQPTNPTPGSNGGDSPSARRKSPPNYLAFNFGPSHDLTKQATPPKTKKKNGCGCGSCESDCNTCAGRDTYPDGTGNTPLSSTRTRQFYNSTPSDWLDFVENNFDSYLSTQSSDNGIPTLTSYVEPGTLN